MRLKIILTLLVFVFVGCNQVNKTKVNISVLPQFEAIDSQGTKIVSEQFSNSPLVVVFFDTESILAWRTLSEFEKVSQKQTNPPTSYLAIGSTKSNSLEQASVNSLKQEYKISFPVIVDAENRFSTLFNAPDCCDSVFLYDVQGKMAAAKKLSELFSKADSFISPLTETKQANDSNPENKSSDEENSASANKTDFINALTVKTERGKTEPIPLSKQGLTLVNLFGQFCADCATGQRLERLNSLTQNKNEKLTLSI